MRYSEKNFTNSSLSSSEPHSTPPTKAIVQLISSLTNKTQIRLLSQYISVYKELNLKKEKASFDEEFRLGVLCGQKLLSLTPKNNFSPPDDEAEGEGGRETSASSNSPHSPKQ